MLSILTYNSCFGLRANTTWHAYNSTWRIVHKRGNPQEIQGLSDFSDYFEAVDRLEPTICIINEIFDDLHLPQLVDEMSLRGYHHYSIGNSGHHHKPLVVSTIIFCKEPFDTLEHTLRFAPEIPGSGGGAVGIVIEPRGLCILGIHAAFKEPYLQQHILELDELYEYLKTKYDHIIFAGDFNRNPSYFQKYSVFANELQHLNLGQRTFPSFIPWYLPFKFLSPNITIGSIDNSFFTNNLQNTNTQIIPLRSDHRAVYTQFSAKTAN